MGTQANGSTGLTGMHRSIQTIYAERADMEDLLDRCKDILATLRESKRRQGGVSAKQLQELASAWGEMFDPGFVRYPMSEILAQSSEEARQVHEGTHEMTVQEFAAGLTLVLMHYAEMGAFDLLEASYTLFEQSVEDTANSIARVLEAQA